MSGFEHSNWFTQQRYECWVTRWHRPLKLSDLQHTHCLLCNWLIGCVDVFFLKTAWGRVGWGGGATVTTCLIGLFHIRYSPEISEKTMRQNKKWSCVPKPVLLYGSVCPHTQYVKCSTIFYYIWPDFAVCKPDAFLAILSHNPLHSRKYVMVCHANIWQQTERRAPRRHTTAHVSVLSTTDVLQPHTVEVLFTLSLPRGYTSVRHSVVWWH